MDELKNQASKIKQEQEKQLEEITKTSLEQKGAHDIINTHEKEKRETWRRTLWYKLNTGYLIKSHFSYILKYNKFLIIKAKHK